MCMAVCFEMHSFCVCTVVKTDLFRIAEVFVLKYTGIAGDLLVFDNGEL